MIILLDLNYTLVSNSHQKRAPFIEQIAGEEYRKDLIQLVRPHHVVLITARPVKYKAPTLGNILRKTGWQPTEAIFNDTKLMPHLFKKKAIKDRYAEELIQSNSKFIAIESNPKTIVEYQKMGILCLSVR